MPRWLYVVRDLFVRVLVCVILVLVRIMPANWAYAMGRGLALLVWRSPARWHYLGIRSLELFYGHELSPEERERIGREAAIHLGYYGVEFIRMSFLPIEKALAMVVESEGEEHYARVLAEGKGAIGLAMHYGNWDLSGAYVSRRIRTLYAVGKRQRDEFFDRFTFPWRARYGINNIVAGKQANSAILRALRDNCVLGLLADQNGGSTGKFVPFAGVPASTVPGPGALALKTGAPLLVTYCKRLAPGKLKFVVKPPLDLSGLPADKGEAQMEVLRRMNAAYEAVIREDPTQWLWIHKRWWTRPEGEDLLY